MVLALLFVLAQASPVPDIDGPIYTNPAVMSPGYAFFSFAPSNGAGMGEACSPPNWQLNSEDLGSTPWTTQASVTVTVNQRASPDGSLTADQVSWGGAGVGTGLFGGAVTTGPLGLQTYQSAIWVTADIAGGTVELTDAIFTAGVSTVTLTTGWQQLVLTETASRTGRQLWIRKTASSPATIYLWGGQVAFASPTLPPYYKTGAVGAGAPVTGAKGEVLTFTRASTATCVKGNPTTGIQNGDLVTVTNNQPRVGNPDGLGLALLVEKTSTNVVLRSQEMDNAAWSLSSAGCAGATRTANATTAPDNTVTAEQFDVPACTAGAGRYSVVFTTTAFPMSASPWTVSFYAKGVSGSGTVYAALTPDGTTYLSNSVVCSFVSDSWTRCTGTATSTLTNYYLTIGSDHRDPSQSSNFAATSVYIWGVQAEGVAYATSYIPTTSAAVTRAADSAVATVALDTSGGASMAVSVYGGPYNQAIFLRLNKTADTSNRLQSDAQFSTSNYTSRFNTSFAGPAASATGTARTSSNAVRIATAWDGTSVVTSVPPGGTTVTATDPRAGWVSGELWISVPAANVDGYVRGVCVDPSPTKCR